MSTAYSCNCDCHNVTGANPMGCSACSTYHSGTTPQIHPQFPSSTIDYSPAILDKLDKIIELLEKILENVDIIEKR